MLKDADIADRGKNVVIFANCHGWVVRFALKAFAPDFSTRSAVHFIPNYTEDYSQFSDVIENCDYLLFQTEKGKEIQDKFEAITRAAPRSVKVLRFPMVGFNVFWPTVFQDYSAIPDEGSGKVNFHFADRNVIRLWKSGLGPEKIVETYMSTPPVAKDHLERSMKFWIDSYHAQELSTDVAVSDLILERVLKEQTFYWPTHCSNAVIFGMVERMLRHLDKTPLAPEAAEASDSLHDWELPIHPAVAEAFELPYWSGDAKYLMPDGRRLSIEDYLLEYVAYLPRRYPDALART